MPFDRIVYEVYESYRAPRTLTIERSGKAVYELQSNAPTPAMPEAPPEIGIYERQLAPTEVESLQRLAGISQFAGLQDDWGRVPSDAAYRHVSVWRGSQVMEKIVITRESGTSGLREVFSSSTR